MSKERFRVLAALGTGCRVVGWILGILAVVAGITAAITSDSWQGAYAGAGVFAGSLVGSLLLVAQGQLIKAILSIEKHTRPSADE